MQLKTFEFTPTELFTDITDDINQFIKQLGFTCGLCLVYSKHEVDCLVVSENGCADGQNHRQEIIPILDNKLDLGEFQRLLFLDTENKTREKRSYNVFLISTRET